MVLKNFTLLIRLVFCFGIIFYLGCGESTPDIVPARGLVTIKGKPFPKVNVKFIPLAKGLDGSYIASGTTDNDGKFALSLPGKDDFGCCACACKVVIEEAPFPDEVKATYNTSKHRIYERYENSLKYRPIPKKYTSLRTTPLKVEVTAENNVHNFEL